MEKMDGNVLADRERNYHDDSYFYAIWYDPESDRVKEETYGATAWAGGMMSIPVGYFADEGVTEKALRATYRESLEYVTDKAYKEIDMPQVGKEVEVVSGRKVKIGTRGYVAVLMENPYDKYNYRVALQVYPTMAYTYSENLKVVDPMRYFPNEEELRLRAAYETNRRIARWQVNTKEVFWKVMKEFNIDRLGIV